jgi:hypothetical protein
MLLAKEAESMVADISAALGVTTNEALEVTNSMKRVLKKELFPKKETERL